MRPEPADAGRVRIVFHVRVLVVQPVRGDPENRTALEGQGAAERETILEPFVRLEPAMRVKAVVTHADPEPGRNAVQGDGSREIRPAEGPERRNGLDVKPDQDDAGQDAQLAISGCGRNRSGGLHALSSARVVSTTLPKGAPGDCKSCVIPWDLCNREQKHLAGVRATSWAGSP